MKFTRHWVRRDVQDVSPNITGSPASQMQTYLYTFDLGHFKNVQCCCPYLTLLSCYGSNPANRPLHCNQQTIYSGVLQQNYITLQSSFSGLSFYYIFSMVIYHSQPLEHQYTLTSEYTGWDHCYKNSNSLFITVLLPFILFPIPLFLMFHQFPVTGSGSRITVWLIISENECDLLRTSEKGNQWLTVKVNNNSIQGTWTVVGWEMVKHWGGSR